MEFEFGVSNKGKPTVIYCGYEFHKKQVTKKNIHWICAKYRATGCTSTVITAGDSIAKIPVDHICKQDIGKPAARKVIASMKESALTTTALTQ